MYCMACTTVMLTYLRAYYERYADGMYQAHNLRIELFSDDALEKLLFSELPVFPKAARRRRLKETGEVLRGTFVPLS